jgi:hypothetical protein
MSSDPLADKRKQERLKELLFKLPFYARHNLKIRDKVGLSVPLTFNRAQEHIQARLEEQLRVAGRVRAIILKGRQMGSTTLVAARYYHKAVTVPGTSTFILSHEAKTTEKLFDIVKRFYQFSHPSLAPSLGSANKNQLKFDGLSSEYTVGTAGNEEVGRGFTIKLLHLSEAASYERTDELETGLLQAVADLPGTEIIIESTAKGMNNMFYRKCMGAMNGKNEYQLIFVPWFWQEDYRSAPPEGFIPTSEELQLKSLYQLDNAQLYWRRRKIESLGDLWKFQQEFPCHPMEAFVTSSESFLSSQLLMEARKRPARPSMLPKICGMDPARTSDRIAITCRQGRSILWWKKIDPKDMPPDPSVCLANLVMRTIDREQIDKFFIDVAQGYGIIDICRASGYQKIVQGVHFGQVDDDRFLNKRAEMAFNARAWLEEGEASIPDDDEFFADLLSMPMYQQSPSGKIFFPAKAQIKKDFGRSPDAFDSFILTFAFPVHSDIIKMNKARAVNNRAKRPSELVTLNRIRQDRGQNKPAVKIMADF